MKVWALLIDHDGTMHSSPEIHKLYATLELLEADLNIIMLDYPANWLPHYVIKELEVEGA